MLIYYFGDNRLKMKYITLLILVILFVSGQLNSQQITMKRNNYVTEIKIKINPEYIYSYYLEDNQVKIKFKSSIKLNLTKLPENPFIAEIGSSKDSIVILVNRNIDVFMNKEKDGLKIVLAKDKKFDELLLKSDINPPKMVNTDVNNVDEVAENALIKIDDTINKKQFNKAIDMINNFLKNTSDGFYAIEAYYKLGETYMKLGESSEIYYKRAAEIFDNFTTRYPSYFRYNDALANAALASYDAHDYENALKFYKIILDRQHKVSKGKEALQRMGEIYTKIGQNDRAVEIYMDFIKKYGENTEINNKIGYLYAKMGDFNTAYSYFYDFIESKQFDFVNPDMLFEIAKVLENKKLYNKANEIYQYIYEKHKGDVNAGEAIYRSANIYQNLGNNEAVDKLLLNCKNNYSGDLYGQLCTLQYAEKHVSEENGDYWKSFLNNVINSESSDLRARAHLILLKAFYQEGNTEEALNLIKTIETEYLSSSVIDDEAKLKQDILRKMAEKKLRAGDFDEAKKIIDELKEEFPSAKVEDLIKLKQDILYKMAEDKFKNGDYDSAKNILKAFLNEFPSTEYRKDIEALLAKIENIKENEKMNKFISLMDDRILNIKNYNDYVTFLNYLRTISTNDNYTQVPVDTYIHKVYPEFIKYLYSKGDVEGFTIALLDYISLVGKESVDKNIISNFYKIIEDRIMEDVDSKEYVSAIREYERIKPIGIDREYLEVIDEYISYALFKLGEKEKAKDFLMDKKRSLITKYGKLMDIVINNKIPVDEINKYPISLIKFLINELETVNPILAYSFVSAYKNDDNLTLTSQHNIIERTSDENVRANLLVDFYLTLKNKDKKYKEYFADVFYQAGLVYYDDSNYNGVVDAFGEYESVAKDNDNLAQAYYLMGKSYVNLNKIDLARQYFMRVINSYPTSPLANMAQQELEKISS
jgi:TolA-binding protein